MQKVVYHVDSRATGDSDYEEFFRLSFVSNWLPMEGAAQCGEAWAILLVPVGHGTQVNNFLSNYLFSSVKR